MLMTNENLIVLRLTEDEARMLRKELEELKPDAPPSHDETLLDQLIYNLD